MKALFNQRLVELDLIHAYLAQPDTLVLVLICQNALQELTRLLMGALLVLRVGRAVTRLTQQPRAMTPAFYAKQERISLLQAPLPAACAFQECIKIVQASRVASCVPPAHINLGKL